MLAWVVGTHGLRGWMTRDSPTAANSSPSPGRRAAIRGGTTPCTRETLTPAFSNRSPSARTRVTPPPPPGRRHSSRTNRPAPSAVSSAPTIAPWRSRTRASIASTRRACSMEPPSGQANTMVLLPWTRMRSSQCQRTARKRTRRSRSRPSARRSSTESRWLTRATSWSMMGPCVELGGDVVRGGAHDLHAALVGLPVRIGAGERGQEGVMDVDDPAREAVHEAGREHLHVAGEHEEVGTPLQGLEHARLGRRPDVPVVRDVEERDLERFHGGAEVGVVGDDQGDIGTQVPPPPVPEQVEERVIVAGDEHRHPAPVGVAREVPLHRHGTPHLLPEEIPETRERHVEPPGLELEAHEVRARRLLRGVLVEVHHVGAVLEEEGRDPGHDARAVCAADEEDGVHGRAVYPREHPPGNPVSRVVLILDNGTLPAAG